MRIHPLPQRYTLEARPSEGRSYYSNLYQPCCPYAAPTRQNSDNSLEISNSSVAQCVDRPSNMTIPSSRPISKSPSAAWNGSAFSLVTYTNEAIGICLLP